MNELYEVKEKIQKLEDDRAQIFIDYFADYGEGYCDDIDEFDLMNEIYEWEILRDLDNNENLVISLINTKTALEEFSKGGAKDIHRANKMLETVVSNARDERKKLKEQIEQIEKNINEYNRIIEICDKYRK